MTSGQWRVLGILLATLGIEIVASPATRAFFVDLYHGRSNSDMPGVTGAAFGFSLGALALVGIAAFAEGFATALAVLFLVIVLLNRGDVIGPALQQSTNLISGLTGQNPQAGTQGK